MSCDAISKEVFQFDTSVATVGEVIKYIQERLPQAQNGKIATVRIFREAFGMGIHTAMEIVYGGAYDNLTVDEALDEIRRMEQLRRQL